MEAHRVFLFKFECFFFALQSLYDLFRLNFTVSKFLFAFFRGPDIFL